MELSVQSPLCQEQSNNPIKTNLLLTLLAVALFAGGYTLLLLWFKTQDFYHNDFFHNGLVVTLYNVCRILFAAYVVWIVYASGFAMVSMMVNHDIRQRMSLAERMLLGFGVGLGCWHLLMLLLGHYNWYYPSVLMGITLCIVIVSAPHFLLTIREAWIKAQGEMRHASYVSWFSSAAICISLALLLAVRGLYPGGGGDYYTHYFPYYLTVLKNHGLAPNDVWYHYYYSKGAGLHFLGMLLTDPEAPALMTYCCVAMAVLAMVDLIRQVAPKSFWPAFCVIIYILYSLVVLDSSDGGEFQKVHEETTAMMLLSIWAVCKFELNPTVWKRPAFMMLAMMAIAAAILTQAAAIFLGIFFAAQVVVTMIRRQWSKSFYYFSLGSITLAAVALILLMNYLMTGLFTDQAFNLMWKYANVERLNQWGVLPNVMMVAWIRDNYDMVAVPWALQTDLAQLLSFMRLDVLHVLVIGVLSLSLCMVELIFTYPDKVSPLKLIQNEFKVILFNVGMMTLVFALIAVIAGHSQSVSFYRFCTFFLPLITIFCTVMLIYLSRIWIVPQLLGPVLLLVIILHSWTGWMPAMTHIAKQAASFMIGRYSVATAYAHQPTGLPFGGIHPGAYAAYQHVPTGSRIWSTNVDSYCMAPDCQIESVISFKLSSHLNEILSGAPETAKKILQQEKLNYFLVMSDSQLLDLLPFSQLFNSNNIGNYFGIKWTNGKTYLLTWRENGTTPLTPKFMRLYKRLIKEANHPWFRFDEAVIGMNDTMKAFDELHHPWYPITFPWRIKPLPILHESDILAVKHNKD